MKVKVGGAWKNVAGTWIKVGGAWKQVFPNAANFTNGATGTYSSGGISYKYILYTASSSLTVDIPGLADVVVVGGGCYWSGNTGLNMGGRVNYGQVFLPVGTHTVTVGGAAGINARSGASALGSVAYAGQVGNAYASQYSTGAGGGTAGLTLSITGSPYAYAPAAQFSGYGSTGSAGCVIVRVATS